MIRLEREPAPKVLSSPEAERVYAEAAEYFADESDSARRRIFNFDHWPWPNDEVLTALSRTSMKRCSFCGRPDQRRAEMAPLRFRPPQDAVAADGRTSRPHYWWLAYQWQESLPRLRRLPPGKGLQISDREAPGADRPARGPERA